MSDNPAILIIMFEREGGRERAEQSRAEQSRVGTDLWAKPQVLISSYNSLDDGRYFDVESRCSFAFDHITQVRALVPCIIHMGAKFERRERERLTRRVESVRRTIVYSRVGTYGSDVRLLTSTPPLKHIYKPNILTPARTIPRTSLTRTLTTHAREHYPSSSTYAVIPSPTTTSSAPSSSTLAILLVSNKYSPSNFWNGRLRTTYLYDVPSSTLTGTLQCDVHYYEDGNVRLQSKKTLPPTTIAASSSSAAGEIMRTVARVEKGWQEEMNRGFSRLSEGEFKGLRRQLPVTRQKVEWEKWTSYRAGKEIGGGRR